MDRNNNRVDKKNTDVNHQSHGHQEGQQDNIPPLQEGDGQRNTSNNSQQMSNILQDSEEQKADNKNREGENERQP